MNVDISFHYPPELLNLLVDAIPLLNRSKNDVFLFFQGAGVSKELMKLPYEQWLQNKESISKYDIVRETLKTLNANGEKCLRERREVLKRVVEYEVFSSCWPTDQLKAKGLVAEIQKVVNVKDSFTRLNLEREHERMQRIEKEQAVRDAKQKKLVALSNVQSDLYKLFSMKNHQKRGKLLEDILNRLFKTYGISIREAFTLTGDSGEGILEQVDGVVEVEGHLYFVEMKWWDKPLGVPEISQHLVRVYHRSETRALIISASSFTEPAIKTCQEALQQKVAILCTLQEIVLMLENKAELTDLIKKKVQAAQIDKKPFFEIRY